MCSSCEFSVRDLLSWVHFMNTTSHPLSPTEGFYHGAYLALLDGLGCNGKMSSVDRHRALAAAEAFLQDLLHQSGCEVTPQYSSEDTVSDEEQFGIHPFFIRKGLLPNHAHMHTMKLFNIRVHMYILNSNVVFSMPLWFLS